MIVGVGVVAAGTQALGDPPVRVQQAGVRVVRERVLVVQPRVLRRERHGLAVPAVDRDVERRGDAAAVRRVRDAVAHGDRVRRARQGELDVLARRQLHRLTAGRLGGQRVRRPVGPMTVPLVAAFSASCSTKATVAPRPATSAGSSAAISGGCRGGRRLVVMRSKDQGRARGDEHQHEVLRYGLDRCRNAADRRDCADHVKVKNFFYVCAIAARR